MTDDTRAPVAATGAPAMLRLLLVDDEMFVREAFRRVLRGYTVITATNGRDALAKIADDTAFDVVLCDLLMPELGGDELYQAVQTTWPELASRFVFMSGGVDTPSMRDFLRSIPNKCIDKTTDLKALRAIVDEVARSPVASSGE